MGKVTSIPDSQLQLSVAAHPSYIKDFGRDSFLHVSDRMGQNLLSTVQECGTRSPCVAYLAYMDG